MLKLAFEPGHRVEYSMLAEPRPAGPVVGYFRDRPIAAAVVDCFGRRYVFSGIAPRRPNGRYDLEALAQHEWLVEPGLVYACEGASSRRPPA